MMCVGAGEYAPACAPVFFQLRNVENISKLFGVLAVALKNNENI
jgi:hypothetical protein